MGWDDYERELARCQNFDIGVGYGRLIMWGTFMYEGAGQSFGYCIEEEFIKRFMNVFSVEKLQDVNGKECWVTHNHVDIRLVEPLFREDGEPFDVAAWAKEMKDKKM